MRKIVNYTFIEWADKEKFIKKVMNLLNDGYELQGGITFNGHGLYCQSLVKYEEFPKIVKFEEQTISKKDFELYKKVAPILIKFSENLKKNKEYNIDLEKSYKDYTEEFSK